MKKRKIADTKCYMLTLSGRDPSNGAGLSFGLLGVLVSITSEIFDVNGSANPGDTQNHFEYYKN
jgi:hypothetical protein